MKSRDRKVFNVYEGRNELEVVMAVQVSAENIQRLAKITKAVIYEDRLVDIDGVFWGESVDIGDYIISDLAGGHKGVEKEIFENAFTLV